MTPLYSSYCQQNKYLFFRLRESHKMLEGRMQALEQDNFAASPRYRFHPRLGRKQDANKGIEGWLEKKSKLGLWQRRYFRFLTSEETKLGAHLAYFDGVTSLDPKGIIPADGIHMVEHYERSKQNRTFTIKIVQDHSHSGRELYLLRANSPEICNRWLNALKPYAKSLSQADVVERSALSFVMSAETMVKLSKLLKEVKYAKGDWICKRGERTTNFFLLKNGKMGMYIPARYTTEAARNAANQEAVPDIFYCAMTPVSFLGVESFFNAESKRSSALTSTSPSSASSSSATTPAADIVVGPIQKISCLAMEDSTMLKLGSEDIKLFMKEYNQEIKGKLYALLNSGIDKRISQVPFLKDIKPADMAKLKLGLHYRRLNEGQVLFYEGEAGSDFFIVYSGEMKIVHYDAKKDREIHLKTVRKADCFGEIALMLPGVPRTATVIATAPTLLLSLHNETFHSFLDIAKLDIQVVMRERIVNTFKKFHIPFFEAIPEESFHELAMKCKVETFEANEVIFKEGDDGDRFYIISFGKVSVRVDKKHVANLKQGNYFGEVALVVEDTPRTATCVTLAQTVLLSMSKDSFRGFFADRPEALADVELKIAGKKCQIRSIMYHPKGVELFTAFLEKHYAEESIEFWHEVRAFRKWVFSLDSSKGENKDMIQKRAQDLVEKYIREGGSRQVNISSQMAKAVLQEVKDNKTSANTFVQAEGEVVTLLSRDKLGSFKQSQEFKKLMNTVGGYEISAHTKAKGRARGGSRVNIDLGSLKKFSSVTEIKGGGSSD
mmetsp:Transcript_29159/g.49450  ORF Transcript_29159/g.49450 Transcript_29159/m.49450 type:complete len:778 (+) Transcript_29159:66-2399(+)